MGIGVETVCKWVRTYRKSHNMPSYAEEKGIQKKAAQTEGELLYKIKELERELRKKEKELSDEKEKVEILKKSLHMLISKHFQFIHMGSTIMIILHIVEQGSIRLTPMHKRYLH